MRCVNRRALHSISMSGAKRQSVDLFVSTAHSFVCIRAFISFQTRSVSLNGSSYKIRQRISLELCNTRQKHSAKCAKCCVSSISTFRLMCVRLCAKYSHCHHTPKHTHSAYVLVTIRMCMCKCEHRLIYWAFEKTVRHFLANAIVQCECERDAL